MVKSSALQFLIPGLLIGALGGYFVAEIRHNGTRSSSSSSRSGWSSAAGESIDYSKLAQACLDAAPRGVTGGRSSSSKERVVSSQPLASVDPEKIQKRKEFLDRLMSSALEHGTWSRRVSVRARQLMGQLPSSDAAAFARLFSTAVERGDLVVPPGVWTPRSVH